MQRLLNDATKLSGVKYDLGNLADMYSAIHIIQTELGITGTTAEEAATTLTGSFAAMKAAAENVLGSLSTGADLAAPLSALVETAQTFLLDNLLPMVGNALAGIPELVYALVPEILQAGTELLSSLAQGFTEGIPAFLSDALPQLLQFSEQLRANAGQFVEAGLNFITQLLNGLIAGLPQLIAYAPEIIINLAGIINDNMPMILAQGVSIIVQLIVGLAKAVPSLLSNWKKILQAVLSVISAINWLNIGSNILKSVGSGVRNMGSSLLSAFKGGFSSALNWIKSLPAQALQWGKNLIQSLINGLTGKGGVVGIGSIVTTAGATIAETASGDDVDWSAAWTDANDDIADSAQTMADITIPAYTKSGDAASEAAKKVTQAAQTITETVQWSLQDVGHSFSTNPFGQVAENSTELTEHVLKSDGTAYDRFTRTVTESGKEMVNGVLKNFKLVTKEVTKFDENGKKIGDTVTTTQKVYEEIAATVAQTVTSTTQSVVDGIQTSTQIVTETLTDKTERQKQVITQTSTDIINGALATVETVRTIAADGTETTAKTIREAAANSFSGLWKELQTEAGKGVLGTFSTLFSAVKKKDWLSVGEWVLSTLYNGLAPENKKYLEDLAVGLIRQINEELAKRSGTLSAKAWELGQKLAQGISNGLDEALQSSGGLMQLLGSIGTKIGTIASNIGVDLSGLAGSVGGLGSLFANAGGAFQALGGIIAANPEIAAILAIVAGVAALGAAIWALFGKGKGSGAGVSHYESPFAGSGVYDSLEEFSTRAAMQHRQIAQSADMRTQLYLLQQIRDMLDEHLPDIGSGQVVLDGDKVGDLLVPRMATNLDMRMGITVQRSGRGV